MSPRLRATSNLPLPSRASKTSVKGMTQGAILSSIVPAKKPRLLPAGMLGRVRMILCILWVLNISAAIAAAM